MKYIYLIFLFFSFRLLAQNAVLIEDSNKYSFENVEYTLLNTKDKNLYYFSKLNRGYFKSDYYFYWVDSNNVIYIKSNKDFFIIDTVHVKFSESDLHLLDKKGSYSTFVNDGNYANNYSECLKIFKSDVELFSIISINCQFSTLLKFKNEINFEFNYDLLYKIISEIDNSILEATISCDCKKCR